MKVSDVSSLTKLVEIGTELGVEHAQDHERFRTHWEEHVANSRKMILRGAEMVKETNSVTVLGGGAGYNIPLEELAQRFELVRLVDIDRNGLQQTVDRLDENLRSKVESHVADITRGMATRLLAGGLAVIEAAASAEEAMRQLASLFNAHDLDMAADAGKSEEWTASYVVSSGLSSQLILFPQKGILKALHEKFGEELGEELELDLLEKHFSNLRDEWVRRHGEFLATVVSPQGRIYWADTVGETPYLSEFGSGPLATVVSAVAAFLERAYLKTFLTVDGKQVLAERFAQGLPGPHLNGDELIQAFDGRLHSEQKRRFAWAIMTLVGEGLITPKRELDLVTHIIREAERLFPQARQPLLAQGILSVFFPASLEPDDEMASWLWINDPEGAVTLDGHSYYVDAHILKKI